MKYNTEEKKLAMPEYGRNIQNMVDYCVEMRHLLQKNLLFVL